MKIYPAIDIMDEKVVRLTKGDREKIKVYGEPIEVAKWIKNYFDSIHIVDLDGAFTGEPKNLHIVERIVKEVGVNVELGGGFRKIEFIKRAKEIGVKDLIIGTKAFDLNFLKKAKKIFDKISVSIDAKDGKVYVSGWNKRGIDVFDAYKKLKPFVNRFIYTAIDRDGTLTGIEKIEKFWGNEEFIYAGGVSSVDDIKRLKEIGFSGVIVGKAIYEGRITLKELKEVEDACQENNRRP